jgi:hypothetical protein
MVHLCEACLHGIVDLIRRTAWLVINMRMDNSEIVGSVRTDRIW